MAENHNLGLHMTSPDSRYCKYVHADDWLYRDCIRKMAGLAESHPEVGIVGAYGRSGLDVRWTGLPSSTDVLSGMEICRRSLLGGFYVFGSPTSVLFRSEVCRRRESLFNPSPYAVFCDQEACYSVLSECDFGFVHEVLTYTRIHQESSTSQGQMTGLNADLAAALYVLTHYGRTYLSDEEYRGRLNELLDRYYRFLGASLFRRKATPFWTYHVTALRHTGNPIDRMRLGRAGASVLVDALFRPERIPGRMLRRLGLRRSHGRSR